ncbi:MAG: 6-phosphogluconolactonase [Trichloromonas sp.]|jgi:6-phosphogluconolactonase|nr:6-phosphogluconolactonase [Trichloromonas sp.]
MIRVFADAEDLARGAAAFFAEEISRAVTARGRASVLLAGGETPRRTYELLAEASLRETIPWDKIHFFWGDERCVPADDPRSNQRLARESLLDRVPAPPANIHPILCAAEPEEAAATYQHELERYFAGGAPSFDLVLLGLGTDGHTASLFPGSSGLAEESRWTAVVRRPGEAFPRITLTLPLLNQARRILFLVAGRGKAAVLAEILQGDAPYPARLVRPSGGELIWFADRAAAGDGCNEG